MLASTTSDFDGIQVHTWEGGNGFPVLMLHGVGPGTSIEGNFGPVLEPLAGFCRIVAADLIGFGRSGRKPAPPFFDVELWVRQAEALLARLPPGPCGIAGHSMGGAIALKVAARNPRITRVLTSSSVGTRYAIPEALDAFWAATGNKDALRAAMRRMVDNPAAVTEAMIEDRLKYLSSGDYASYFEQMFAAPRQRYLDQGVLADTEIGAIKAEVVMLHGRSDQPCPAELTTLALAQKLPKADVHLLARCGHNLPRERTADYIAAARALFATS